MPAERSGLLYIPHRCQFSFGKEFDYLTTRSIKPFPRIIDHLSHNAHDYFLNFRLPHIRRKLTEAITGCPGDIAFAITKFFDDYVYEVHKHMSYEEKIVFPYVRNLLEG